MTRGLVNQIVKYVPGMTIGAIYNRTQSKAIQVLEQAGIKHVPVIMNSNDLKKALLAESPCVVTCPSLLWESKSDIDVVVEMTGTISEAFDWICASLQHGKKVVSFNAELDATLGPYLQRLARSNGTRYTLADGDQPGVTMNLVREVRSFGLIPLVCGNIKGFLNNHRTPDDQREFAKLYGLSLNMVTSFTDGTKVALEQACIANACGLRVAQRGMLSLSYQGHVDELTKSYDLEDLQRNGGIVEMVVGARPGPGVFVLATTNDPLSKRFLKYLKLGEGPLYSFYRPYHLCYFEIPNSIVRLVDFDDGTLDSVEVRVEVVAIAKRPLRAGECLDGLGGYTHYGLCENASVVRKQNLLPSGLAEGKVLARGVQKDEALSWDDLVDAPKSALEIAYHSMVGI